MGSNGREQVARAAVLAMHRALQALRQHPDAPGLCDKALHGAVRAVAAATAAGPLVLQLCAGAVHVDGAPIVPFHPGEPPFGLLRDGGIGELVLARAIPAPALHELLLRFAAMPANGDPEDALASLCATARVEHVELRALADLATAPVADDDGAWAGLPPPVSTSPALRAQLERDLTPNLPALVVRQLLDDCERDGAPPGDALDRLLARLLERRDAGTAAALLVEAQGQPALTGAAAERLAAIARARCDAAWFEAALRTATHDEALALSGLAMQLGDDVAARFAAAAGAVAHPLSEWLGELLGQRPR